MFYFIVGFIATVLIIGWLIAHHLVIILLVLGGIALAAILLGILAVWLGMRA